MISNTVEFTPVRTVPAPAGDFAGLFYGQLAGLLKAGMPLPRALHTLAAESGSKRFREAIQRAATALENGASPEQAFTSEESALGGLLGRVAAATAASGKLAPMLAELSLWTLAQDKIRRRIRDALAYPCIVLFLTALLTVVMGAVTGNFGMQGDALSREFEMGELPWVSVMAPKLCYAVFVFTAAIPLCSILARISPALRRFNEQLCCRLPILGAVCRPLALTRFCGSVSILMKAGVAYHEAVAAAGELTGFVPYSLAARRVARILEAGGSQTEAWRDSSLFPPSLNFILASAAERGDVPVAFAELAELYQIEADGRGRMVALLAPPACLIAVGLIVSVFIAGMLAPLINMMRMIG